MRARAEVDRGALAAVPGADHDAALVTRQPLRRIERGRIAAQLVHEIEAVVVLGARRLTPLGASAATQLARMFQPLGARVEQYDLFSARAHQQRREQLTDDPL